MNVSDKYLEAITPIVYDNIATQKDMLLNYGRLVALEAKIDMLKEIKKDTKDTNANFRLRCDCAISALELQLETLKKKLGLWAMKK